MKSDRHIEDVKVMEKNDFSQHQKKVICKCREITISELFCQIDEVSLLQQHSAILEIDLVSNKKCLQFCQPAARYSLRTNLAIQEAEKWPACLESLGYNIFLKLYQHSHRQAQAQPLTSDSPRAGARWGRSGCRG